MTISEQGPRHSIAWDGVRSGFGISSLGFLVFDAACAINNQEISPDVKSILLTLARIAGVAQSVAPTYRLTRLLLQPHD